MQTHSQLHNLCIKYRVKLRHIEADLKRVAQSHRQPLLWRHPESNQVHFPPPLLSGVSCSAPGSQHRESASGQSYYITVSFSFSDIWRLARPV